MPPREWKFRVEDMLTSIDKIKNYTSGLSFEKFSSNSMVIDAVIRNLEIIGEAAAHIPATVIEKTPDIPWRQLKGMRNLVIHEYFNISLKIIWDTIQSDLDPLIDPLQRLLQEF